MLAAVFIVFFGIILARIFTLQVVNGKSYQENFSLKIQMKQPINAARGNIYDKNGKLLAYNELAYSISINDSTTYSSTKEKNKAVNAELAEILTVLKNNGETLNNDFKIDRKKDGTYSFNVSGSSLNRFRADVFGKRRSFGYAVSPFCRSFSMAAGNILPPFRRKLFFRFGFLLYSHSLSKLFLIVGYTGNHKPQMCKHTLFQNYSADKVRR